MIAQATSEAGPVTLDVKVAAEYQANLRQVVAASAEDEKGSQQ